MQEDVDCEKMFVYSKDHMNKWTNTTYTTIRKLNNNNDGDSYGRDTCNDNNDYNNVDATHQQRYLLLYQTSHKRCIDECLGSKLSVLLCDDGFVEKM